jgi:predicted sulfurtransferase
MRNIMLLTLLSSLTIGIACSNAAPPVRVENTRAANTQTAGSQPDAHQADDAERITLADAKKDFDAGNAVFIDTRDEASYKQEHIKGALNIPAASLDAKIKDIPAGKKIIAYCS